MAVAKLQVPSQDFMHMHMRTSIVIHDVAELNPRARTLVNPCISLSLTLSQSTYA